MKKFKEFKSEQQYVTEIGPIAATLMGAMALWGGYQAFKKVKSKIKGYKKSKSEKAQNKKTGLVVDLKVFNSETGETDTIPKVIEPGSKESAIDDELTGKESRTLYRAGRSHGPAAVGGRMPVGSQTDSREPEAVSR